MFKTEEPSLAPDDCKNMKLTARINLLILICFVLIYK